MVLSDADVEALADMASAIAVVENLFRAKAAGSFVAPARHYVPFGQMIDLVFAVGGSKGGEGVAGFRAYYSRATRHYDDQLAAVWDTSTGALKGIILGATLGAIRMGAIGGVAMRALARPDASIVAVIGSGRQAATHLRAAAVVRPISEARVYSLREPSAQSFARRMSEELGFAVTPQGSARAAVDGADIVVLATTSLRPVLQADWLSTGAFVHTVGFKSPAGKEMDLDVAERAGLIVTDSHAQIKAAGKTFILHDTPHLDRVVELAEFVAGKRAVPADPAAITVCYPMGITGSDVVVANDLLCHFEAAGGPL